MDQQEINAAMTVNLSPVIQQKPVTNFHETPKTIYNDIRLHSMTSNIIQ